MTRHEKDILEQIYDCTSDEDDCDKLKAIRVLANILLKKTPRLDFIEYSTFHFVHNRRNKKC